MGYDYYIIKIFQVKYLDTHGAEQYLTIEVNRQGCYFYEREEDSDSDNTEEKYRKYLNVSYIPKILFNNNKWANERVKDKYFSSIQNQIGNGLIISVVKKEERYLR